MAGAARGGRWADDAAAIDAMQRKVPATMTDCFALIEKKLLKGPWVMGEQFTICDPYLFTIASWLEGDGVDTGKLPRVLDHRRRMLARPAVQKPWPPKAPRSPDATTVTAGVIGNALRLLSSDPRTNRDPRRHSQPCAGG
jgi:glutathione S-transferase